MHVDISSALKIIVFRAHALIIICQFYGYKNSLQLN